MLSVDSDIRVFNQHVRIIRQGLTCRGESIDDLMVHLFRGYLQARDANFRQYLERKKESWEEGTDFTPDELMTWALNKYTLLKSRHKWGLESAEDQLVVLTSTVNNLKDDNLKLTRALSQKVSNKSNKGLAPLVPSLKENPIRAGKRCHPHQELRSQRSGMENITIGAKTTRLGSFISLLNVTRKGPTTQRPKTKRTITKEVIQNPLELSWPLDWMRIVLTQCLIGNDN